LRPDKSDKCHNIIERVGEWPTGEGKEGQAEDPAAPRFLTAKAKWDDKYRKKWGIRNGPAAALPPGIEEKLATIARRVYRILHIRGLGRIDVRLKASGDGSPWSLCRRPWSLMYFTANGRALPCCIAPFSQHGYDNYTLGHAEKQPLQDIWNGPAYREFRAALLSDKPPKACASCGLRWSL